MKVTVKGLTPSVIAFTEVTVLSGANLNLHGQVEAIVDLDTPQKENEVNVLFKAGLISSEEYDPNTIKDPKSEVIENTEDETDEDENETKRGRGRPKGSKNKKKELPKTPVPDLERVIEDTADAAEDAQDSSRAVVMTAGGDAVDSEMKNNMIGEAIESDNTKASLEAMEKLNSEERDAESFTEESKVDESEQDLNNQMGGSVTIGAAEGAESAEMKNSILPEDTNVQSDPFIDREENTEDTEGTVGEIAKENAHDPELAFIPEPEGAEENDPFIDSGVNADPLSVKESDDILEL